MHTNNAPYFKHVPLANGLTIFQFNAMVPESFSAWADHHEAIYTSSRQPIFMLIDLGGSLIFPFLNLTILVRRWVDAGYIPTTTRHAYLHAPTFPDWAGFHYSRLQNVDFQAQFFLSNQRAFAMDWLLAERDGWLSSQHRTTPAGSLS